MMSQHPDTSEDVSIVQQIQAVCRPSHVSEQIPLIASNAGRIGGDPMQQEGHCVAGERKSVIQVRPVTPDELSCIDMTRNAS